MNDAADVRLEPTLTKKSRPNGRSGSQYNTKCKHPANACKRANSRKCKKPHGPDTPVIIVRYWNWPGAVGLCRPTINRGRGHFQTLLCKPTHHGTGLKVPVAKEFVSSLALALPPASVIFDAVNSLTLISCFLSSLSKYSRKSP